MSAAEIVNPWKGQGYTGTINVDFEPVDRKEQSFPDMEGVALKVYIYTERLELSSASTEVAEFYHQGLLGNEEVMVKFADGKPRTEQQVQTRLQAWEERWKNNNPWSAFVVREIETDRESVGHVLLGGGEGKGNSELAFMVGRKSWGRGYGTEMVTSMVNGYAPELIRRGDKVPSGEDGQPLPFAGIEATARTDNPGSYRILDRLMTRTKTEEKHGVGPEHMRFHYFVSKEDLEKRV